MRILEKNLTNKEIAITLQITQSTMSRWINGKGTEQIEKFIGMCKLLDLDPRDLLE